MYIFVDTFIRQRTTKKNKRRNILITLYFVSYLSAKLYEYDRYIFIKNTKIILIKF